MGQTVEAAELDIFVACGLGGHKEGLQETGKEYSHVLEHASGEDVEAQALRSSTAAWNLGRRNAVLPALHKIAFEIKQLSSEVHEHADPEDQSDRRRSQNVMVTGAFDSRNDSGTYGVA